MRLPRAYSAAAFGAVILGAILAAGLLELPTGKKTSAGQQAWQLPSLPSVKASQASYQRLAKRYKKPAGATGTSRYTAHWQLVGVVQQGEVPLALIKSGDKVSRYEQGDSLPDGSTLATIHARGIVVESQSGSEEIHLYNKVVETPRKALRRSERPPPERRSERRPPERRPPERRPPERRPPERRPPERRPPERRPPERRPPERR